MKHIIVNIIHSMLVSVSKIIQRISNWQKVLTLVFMRQILALSKYTAVQ